MKRLLRMLMVMLLLGNAALCEVAEVEAFVFSFRNGVQWRDTLEIVKEKEAGEAVVWEDDERLSQLSYGNASVSNFTADLNYNFLDGELSFIHYTFQNLPEEEWNYLADAVSSKYGEPITADSERVMTLINAIDPIDDEPESLTNWQLEDGTYVAAVRIFGAQMLIYFNEADVLNKLGIFNTSGL